MTGYFVQDLGVNGTQRELKCRQPGGKMSSNNSLTNYYSEAKKFTKKV